MRHTLLMQRLATRCVNGVGVCLLPHKRNGYRPWALRHRPLALVSAILISVKTLALFVVAITPLTAELSTITADRIVQLTNAERTSQGLNALTVNSQLTQAAQAKATDILKYDYFAHISPTGVTPWFWMHQAGYSYQVAGENLAIDFVEAENVVAAWMASPSHRDNVMHPSYVETGVAVMTGEFQGGTSTVVVHMFGLPTGSTAVVTTPTPTPIPATAGTKTEPTTPPAIPTTIASPEPTPTPDMTPPRAPRIALVSPTNTYVGETVVLDADSESDSSLHFVTNGQPRDAKLLTDGTYEVPISDMADGVLEISAFSTDESGNKGPMSGVIKITKDTEGPRLTPEGIRAIVGPTTDQPLFLTTIDAAADEKILIQEGDEVYEYAPNSAIELTSAAATLRIRDVAGNESAPLVISFLPDVQYNEQQNYMAPPARLSRAARMIIGIISVIIFFLLLLAIIIRVRIQHPALIAHASFVLLLAGILLLL